MKLRPLQGIPDAPTGMYDIIFLRVFSRVLIPSFPLGLEAFTTNLQFLATVRSDLASQDVCFFDDTDHYIHAVHRDLESSTLRSCCHSASLAWI